MCVIETFTVYHPCVFAATTVVVLNFTLTFSIIYTLGTTTHEGEDYRWLGLKNFTLVHFSSLTRTRSPLRSDSLNKFNYLHK